MIAIIGMAQEEIGYFKSMAEISAQVTYAGMEFYSGRLEGTPVVMVCSPMGKVPLAVAAQIVIDRFEAEMVIVSGPAGPLVPYLQQGDMVIADRLIQHDAKFMTNPEAGNRIVSSRSLVAVRADLLTRITEAYNDVFGGKSNRPQLVMGTVVSSDQPVLDRRTVGLLQRDYGAVAIDRDGATAARVCRMNEKPFILIRTVVDSPDGDFYNCFDSQLQVVPEYITALVKRFIAVPYLAPVI
jgi:adenosylhomocysteine nucleosidase